MSYAVQLDESNASRRVIYMWCVQSNGTSAATNEAGGRPRMSVGALSMWTTANTLSAISANAGLYSLVLGASDISLAGQGVVGYSSSTALPTTTNVEIVGYNPFTAYSTFTSADSVGLKAQTHSGATVAGLVSDVSVRNGDYSAVTVRVGGGALTSAVTLAAGRYSNVTIGGVERVESHVTIASGSYSSLTIAGVTRVNSNVTIADNDYSGVTVRVAGNIALTSAVTLAAGRYSNVTIGGVERVESNVTIANADYSAVTVRTSDVTIAAGGIESGSFAPSAIDAVAVATDTIEEFADGVLGRNIAGGSDGGRPVSSALYPLRNRVQIDGSTGTVYQVNDSTSAWTFSATTVSANSGILNQVDPG